MVFLLTGEHECSSKSRGLANYVRCFFATFLADI